MYFRQPDKIYTFNRNLTRKTQVNLIYPLMPHSPKNRRPLIKVFACFTYEYNGI